MSAPATWVTWSPAVLDRASSQQRPIALLLTDPLDHWSRIWPDELGADEELGELWEAGFVTARACRRSEPALAQRAQAWLAASSGAQGWPCLAFLSDEGRSLGATPYGPARDQDKRIGVARLALQVAAAWADDPQALRADARRLEQMIAPGDEVPPLPARSDQLLFDSVESACLEAADQLEGGFGHEPRGLCLPILDFLVARIEQDTASPLAAAQVERSIDAMLSGGLSDHLGGGLFRGSQDRSGFMPFFEKRLRDQLQASQLIERAAPLFERPWWQAASAGGLAWADEHLSGPGGAWTHGLSASSAGGDGQLANGAYYGWTEALAAAVVGTDGARIVAERYLAGPAFAEEFRIPAARGDLNDGQRERLPGLVARMAAARHERPPPAQEQRCFAAELGMACWALAGTAEHHDRAKACWAVLDGPCCDDSGALLLWYDGSTQGGPADSATLAWAARGAWAWYQTSSEAAAQSRCREWLDILWLSRRPDGCLSLGPLPVLDSPEPLCATDEEDGPSAAAVAIDAYRESGQTERAQALVDAYRPLMAAAPLAMAGLAAAAVRVASS